MNSRELLNKIKWNEHDKDRYFIFYADRFSDNLKKINFQEIKEIGKSFLTVEQEGKDVEIPIHRIREIRKEGKLIWRKGL